MSTATALARRSDQHWISELRHRATRGPALEDLGRFLYRTLARTLGSRGDVDDCDLEDFTQEALMRIHLGLDRFRGDSRFTTWAAAVAIRVGLTALRQRRHRFHSIEDLDQGRVHPEPSTRTEQTDPGASLDRSALMRALETAIELSLTERQRAAVLGQLAGTPNAVLAERLGTNTNALYKLHHDARKRLKLALEEAGFDADAIGEHLLAASLVG